MYRKAGDALPEFGVGPGARARYTHRFMLRIGIIGASGYSGDILVERLLAHPGAELAVVTSRQWAGDLVRERMPRLAHRAGELRFAPSDPEEVAARHDLDAIFLALPHGVATTFARPLFDAGHLVFDLSADFRLSDERRYAEFYGSEHPDPQLLGEAYYALADGPDRADWAEARLFACPGCYPTSILLPLLPLALAGLLAADHPVVAVGMSGVSGAGRKATEDFSFCERNESVRAYGQPVHRHLSELEEQLARAAGQALPIQFLPHLIPMQRGILSTISLGPLLGGAAAVREAWESAYMDRPFVRILPEGQLPETGRVVGTNRIDLAVHDDPRTGRVLLHGAIDNLVKGASGQALQLMNLRCGRPETEGLL